MRPPLAATADVFRREFPDVSGRAARDTTFATRQGQVKKLGIMIAMLGACRSDVRREETWSDDDRTFYALGAVIARRVKHFAPAPAEQAIAKWAITDSVRGLPSPVPLDAQEERIRKLRELRRPMVAAAARVEGARALALAARQPNTVTTPTGVVRRSLSPGNGPSPGPNDKVRVRQETRLTNGALVTRRKSEVVDIATGIPCLKETLPTMKVGERVRITCSPAKAFGEAGAPPRVPGNAVIISTVELLEILEPGAATATTTVARGAP
jgi:FKBP-type peptidyl-prolyl cis-trans isomerase